MFFCKSKGLQRQILIITSGSTSAADAAGDAGDAGDKALVSHFEDSLLVLGELVWRCLKEDRFYFHEEELVEFESTNGSCSSHTWFCVQGSQLKED